MLVSVVIPNYNYADFVAQAIDSALALDWPHVEVIVVDDGSTDASRRVIEGYGNRITALFQANAGQREAYNAGFFQSRGEVVIFLDSDDVLDPSLLRELARVWRAGVSKVQFQMKVVDAHGVPTGALLPQFQTVPSAADVRAWASNAAAYPTPPGSANAYSRVFLQQFFPLQGRERQADSYCLAAAPFLGDVLTVAKPLVAYRIHGRNIGAQSKLESARFTEEVLSAQFRFEFGNWAARLAGHPRPPSALNRSLAYLPYRLASLRLRPKQHPVSEDSRAKVMRDVFLACFVPQGVSVPARGILFVWSLAVSAAPRAFAEPLLLWRFSSAARPKFMNRVLQLLRVTKRHHDPSGREVAVG